MGLGPPVIALYQQLKTLGAFDDIKSVMELGSQNVWCTHATMVRRLFESFGQKGPSDELMHGLLARTAAARELYEGLGFTYNCVDTDAKFGALALDINFDPVPSEHYGRYDLVTNHGTTEHLINQLNAFKMIHDFTRPGGYMLHALPFLGQWDHGFFNYQPNLFDALARYNSYRTLGMWIGIDWQLSSFVPWEPRLLEFLNLSPKSTGLLIVLLQKMYGNDFQVPFQGAYEQTRTSDVSYRYGMVIDGEVYDGRRDKFLSQTIIRNPYMTEIPAAALARELVKRVRNRLGRLLMSS
jgi:SAM-dependent methyltransferase